MESDKRRVSSAYVHVLPLSLLENRRVDNGKEVLVETITIRNGRFTLFPPRVLK